MLIKQGIVKPGVTNDVEEKDSSGQKTASAASRAERLDDDVTKRLSDQAAESLGTKNGS